MKCQFCEWKIENKGIDDLTLSAILTAHEVGHLKEMRSHGAEQAIRKKVLS